MSFADIPDIAPASSDLFLLVVCFSVAFIVTGRSLPKATKCIAPQTVASADLGCVNYRLKMKLAPVRLLQYAVGKERKLMTYSFQDVTTRGNYYPDKNMATAAVGLAVHFSWLGADNPDLEPSPVSTCDEHQQGWTRKSCGSNR